MQVVVCCVAQKPELRTRSSIVASFSLKSRGFCFYACKASARYKVTEKNYGPSDCRDELPRTDPYFSFPPQCVLRQASGNWSSRAATGLRQGTALVQSLHPGLNASELEILHRILDAPMWERDEGERGRGECRCIDRRSASWKGRRHAHRSADTPTAAEDAASCDQNQVTAERRDVCVLLLCFCSASFFVAAVFKTDIFFFWACSVKDNSKPFCIFTQTKPFET